MVAREPLDSPPPPPPPAPPAYVYAATDERPRTPEERKLCEKASEPDWLYIGAGVLLTAGSIALDTWARNGLETQTNHSEPAGFIGPPLIGLTWGFTLGGLYPALPKCSPDYVSSAPPEGDVRTSWEIAAVFAALAGLTAPVIVAVESGTSPAWWDDGERIGRLAVASGLGIVGALVPYVLPPKTWRAAKELEHLRALPTADGRGTVVGWGMSF